MQHDNMISIAIFLLSMPASTKVILPKKKSQDQQTKKWETIKKKTKKVNQIAFIEGILYALPPSTSSYRIKHTSVGDKLSSSSHLTFPLKMTPIPVWGKAMREKNKNDVPHPWK